jgi:hypothetical protein
MEFTFVQILIIIVAIIILVYFLFYRPYLDKKNWIETNKVEYYKIFPKINLPENALIVNFQSSICGALSSDLKDNILLYGNQYVWIEDGNICFFPHVSMISESSYWYYGNKKSLVFEEVKIEIDEIKYFKKNKSIIEDKEMVGGGGGGSSIGKAIIGHAIAGGAGAIIASRKKIEPISYKTTYREYQSTELKCTFLNFRAYLFFDVKSFEVFNRLIPEKNELDYLQLKEREKKLGKKLKKLKKEKKLGIISESDYQLKKNALLNNNKLK